MTKTEPTKCPNCGKKLRALFETDGSVTIYCTCGTGIAPDAPTEKPKEDDFEELAVQADNLDMPEMAKLIRKTDKWLENPKPTESDKPQSTEGQYPSHEALSAFAEAMGEEPPKLYLIPDPSEPLSGEIPVLNKNGEPHGIYGSDKPLSGEDGRPTATTPTPQEDK